MARVVPIIVASGNGAGALAAGIRIVKRGGSALAASGEHAWATNRHGRRYAYQTTELAEAAVVARPVVRRLTHRGRC